jgi:hypothetical protein
MKKPLLRLALAMATGLAAGASHDLTTFIGEYDLDHNGCVSKEEFALERDRRFAATDIDKDGALTRAEYIDEFRARLEATKPSSENFVRQMRQADVRFGVLDANKDQRISPAEFTHSGWMMFTHHDANENGAVASDDGIPNSKQREAKSP